MESNQTNLIKLQSPDNKSQKDSNASISLKSPLTKKVVPDIEPTLSKRRQIRIENRVRNVSISGSDGNTPIINNLIHPHISNTYAVSRESDNSSVGTNNARKNIYSANNNIRIEYSNNEDSEFTRPNNFFSDDEAPDLTPSSSLLFGTGRYTSENFQGNSKKQFTENNIKQQRPHPFNHLEYLYPKAEGSSLKKKNFRRDADLEAAYYEDDLINASETRRELSKSLIHHGGSKKKKKNRKSRNSTKKSYLEKALEEWRNKNYQDHFLTRSKY
ncbi:hypothetical protein AYI68_g44 [Smittium mucronatum]|uniref:Uncharacterized protein n=1 Tax=Smittium mucronatum TaxID=133383 RepID=A0A1R0H9K3_9FUNG|nr:hypothetical protein AYI68_g44 [Smittium mucronatum]